MLIYSAAPHDPIYGIDSKRIAARLSPQNWRRRAVVRVTTEEPALRLYLWSVVARESPGAHREKFFIVLAHNLDGVTAPRFDERFPTAAAAIGAVNGEGRASLPVATRPALASELPAGRGPSWVVSPYRPGFTRGS